MFREIDSELGESGLSLSESRSSNGILTRFGWEYIDHLCQSGVSEAGLTLGFAWPEESPHQIGVLSYDWNQLLFLGIVGDLLS